MYGRVSPFATGSSWASSQNVWLSKETWPSALNSSAQCDAHLRADALINRGTQGPPTSPVTAVTEALRILEEAMNEGGCRR